ncbi:flavin-containing monooxygenase [Geodermatophilus sp. CPCC 206100]|uniref:flavin-containing monooxygenase n=1 Tax=Geodermatophilus sp. CPCC 206100 TaxID=3020054 RepID=UPI003B007D8B
MTQTMDRPGTTGSPAERTDAWLAEFQAALTDRDVDRAAGLFAPTSFWRDLVSFSWNITTVEAPDGVRDLLTATLDSTDPTGFRTTEEPTEADGVITAWLAFETAVGRGRGLLRLVDGKAFTLLTSLSELAGHEEPLSERRPAGAEHGVQRDRQTWAERRRAETEELGRTRQPYVVVVGGGQGGIALGARLRQLDVPHVVVDRHPRPGDQWRNRYKSLCLHDPVWYDHLPYLDFPPNWPVFSPKDKIADWLEMYVRVMEVTYWGASTVTRAAYHEDVGEWTVTVERDGGEVTLRPQHLVMATGVSGKPNVPVFPGQDRFLGDQHHSSRHPGPDAYRGKQAVVIGSNNSAHDIAAALWEHGAEVTMVQRSSTHVVRSDSLMELGLGDLYSERALAAGMTTDKADLLFASLPYRFLPEVQKPVYDAIRERDADYYRRLEEAGFWLDFGEDGSGLFLKYLRRGSGYYIDVGASELVANGDVRLAHGTVRELTEHAVVLEGGTELPADLVVYATGYGPMNGWVADLVSPEVADRVGRVWGLGSGTAKDPGPWEGELRNMWKPTRQEGLWFHGGNLHQSRHYSLFLALQLKARQVGIPTPVHGLPEVQHRS